MRKFSSYGLVDRDLHYYVLRQSLVDQAMTHLVGEEPAKGGHFITVWAPRQRGKSWILQQAMLQMRNDPRYAGVDDDFEYRSALGQAARYARQLHLPTMTIVFFVEAVDDETRTLYEAPYHDAASGVTVEPVLVTTVE